MMNFLMNLFENKDYLRDISNFSGSYGIALILKKNNYLFVDGRYTVQANIQSGKYFQVITLPFKKKKNNLNFKKKGLDLIQSFLIIDH